MTDFEHLDIAVDGPVANVWLHRPPVNAVHQAMYREIHALFSEIDQLGSDIRAVVLGGRGPNFCAGNDLDEFARMDPDSAREQMFHVREAFAAIYTCDVPVVAAVQGAALGTGVAIAGSCDLVIAADDAVFGLPEITVGVMGGAKHLSRLLPQGLVRYLFYTGERLPARDFVAHGGVLKTTPADDLHDQARGIADKVAQHSPVALRYAKQALTQIEFMELQRGYEFEQSLTTELCGHPDSKEALQAILEGREPTFRPAPAESGSRS